MRGYPKHIATAQDFKNLISMPEFKERALRDMQAVYDRADDKVLQVVSGSEETKDLITKETDNPRPRWKQLGFKDRKEVLTMKSLAESKEV